VKYHLGASSDRSFDGNNVHLSLTANPSHLKLSIGVLGKCGEAGPARMRSGRRRRSCRC